MPLLETDMKKILLGIILIVIIAFPIIIPICNNINAYWLERDLKKIELPEETTLIDSLSAAGKLNGNGNGIQYFGAILIKSDLTEEQLKSYYINYRKDRYSCIVEAQTSNKIEQVEHQTCKFDNYNEDEKDQYFIVYSWESPDNYLLDLDLRGH